MRVASQNRRTGRGGNVIAQSWTLERSSTTGPAAALVGATSGNLQGDHLAGFVRRAIDRDDFVVVVHDDGGIDARAEKGHAPDRITGASVDANHAAVARRGIENPLAVQPG